MLTPKHRALFLAAYSEPLLRVAGETDALPAPGGAREEEDRRKDGQSPPEKGPSPAA